MTMGVVSAGTYIPILFGVLLGAIGSIVFVKRTRAFERNQPDAVAAAGQRRLSLRLIVGTYTLVALICLIVAIALGGAAFIVLSAIIAVCVGGAFVRLWWSHDPTR